MAFAEKVVCAEPLVYSNLCSGTFVSLAKPLNILACSFDFQFLSCIATAFDPNCMIKINMHINKDAIYLGFLQNFFFISEEIIENRLVSSFT